MMSRYRFYDYDLLSNGTQYCICVYDVLLLLHCRYTPASLAFVEAVSIVCIRGIQ